MTSLVLSSSLPTLPSPSDFSAYARSVAQIPSLSLEDEKALIEQWCKNKNQDAAKVLVLSHLYLVVKLVRAHRGYGVSEGDLAQEGTVGLMKAVHKFNPTKNVRLGTYAWYWIEAEIKEFILKNWRMVSWGTSSLAKKLFFGYRKTVSALMDFGEHREVPSSSSIAQSLGVSEDDANLTREYFLGGDLEIFGDHDEEVGPSIVLANNTTPEHEMVKWQRGVISDVVFEKIKNLPDRQQDVIKGRYLTSPPLTLTALANKWGVSVERIRQIEKETVEHLRLSMNETQV